MPIEKWKYFKNWVNENKIFQKLTKLMPGAWFTFNLKKKKTFSTLIDANEKSMLSNFWFQHYVEIFDEH
jgi:hypothetical protein